MQVFISVRAVPLIVMSAAPGSTVSYPFHSKTWTFAPIRMLEKVHVDTVGGLPVTLQGGERYFVAMVDDYSGSCDVCPVHLKSQIPHAMINKLIDLQKQSGEREELGF
jgi:hypothetical protein